MTNKRTTCKDHTPCPDGYVARQSWAAKKDKTHKQIKCDQCGLFKIWIPRNLND